MNTKKIMKTQKKNIMIAGAAATAATALPIMDHCSEETPNTTASPARPAQVDGSLARFSAQYTTEFMDYLP